ncbi:MAG: flippase, partial [Candidatus Hydrogenedentes bacterium]|nr:flippase [Candidatus Hydrogenedentota bacterium]
MPVSKTIARNTKFNAAGRFWEAVVGVALLAYVVRTLDQAGYGMWSLLGPFLGYVALLDLGIGSGYAKFIAQYRAREDAQRISEIVTTGLVAYSALGIVIIAAGWAFIDIAIDGVLRFQELRGASAPREWVVEDLRFLFRWGLVLMAVSGCVNVFSAIQTGLQRMGITNVVSFIMSLVKVAATVFFLEKGYGVRGLLYANAVVLSVFAPLSIAIGFFLLPTLRVTPGRFTRRAFRELFGFGWRTQISRLSNLITFETDMVIIGFFLGGVGAVGVYQAGVNLVNKVRQAPLVLLSALIPAASELDAQEDRERFAQLYLRSTKYVASIAVPLILISACLAGPLVRAMFGPGFETSAWVMRILAPGYLANVLAGAGIALALGKGRPDLQMYAGIIAMAVNLALTILLYLSVGFYGVPAATSIAMIAASLWFAGVMRRETGVTAAMLIRETLFWPAIAIAPGMIVCVVADWRTGGLAEWIPNAAVTVAVAAAAAGIYLSVMRYVPFLDDFDRRFLDEHLWLRRLPWLRRLVIRQSRA